MKKITMETIRTALVNFGYDNQEVMDELTAEINRDAEEKAARAAAYEAVHDTIVSNLSDTPATCTELYDAIKKDLPSDFSKGKLQYALTHLWQDEIVKVPGKPNGYKRA